jgi:hypothetical protein
MDPSPATRKDLQPRVEDFIVSWGREILPRSLSTLVIHVDDPPPERDAHEAKEGIRAFFEERALVTLRGLRHLFRLGRISLLIALLVLAVTIVVGELLRGADSPLARGIGGTLEIGGWVAMWRPLQIFLYDWWPIRGDIRLFRRLAEMEVRIVCDRVPSGG